MNLNSLTKIKGKQKRRLGQGHGSGRVKTSGRGTKGQNARSHRSLSFEGGALPLIKRLPFRRGKGKNEVFNKKAIVVNLRVFELLKGTTVDLKSLIDAKIVRADEAKEFGVKILGDGDVKKAYTVKLPTSKQAVKKIEKAGGKVEN